MPHNGCKLSLSSPFKRKDGSLLNGTSGEQHTLAAHDGLTEICHFNSSQWMSQNTLYQILMKGRLWLEAYEIHLQTGEDLEKYLPHMQ